MIHAVIESLATSVECLEMFGKIFPLVEQKEADGKTYLASYIGKGQYENVQNFDSYNGVSYFRQIDDPAIAPKDNEFRACEIMVDAKYSLRLVACIKREQLPEDCAFSDDRFGWMLAKELTGRGGSLKQAIGANKILISATKIITDRKKLLSDEFPGDELPDINYQYSYIGVDFSVDIEIRQSCIDTICDSYYTFNGTCSPRTACNTSLKVVIIDSEAGVYGYPVNIPSTSTITSFHLGQLTGVSSDCALTPLTSSTSTFTITSTDNFAMDQPYKLVIYYI